jgi:hypothetical protein
MAPLGTYRIDFHRNVIVRNRVLCRYLDHLDAQVHADHFLDPRYHQDEAGPLTFSKRPSVKTTARSYSRRILTVAMITANATMVRTGTAMKKFEKYITFPFRSGLVAEPDQFLGVQEWSTDGARVGTTVLAGDVSRVMLSTAPRASPASKTIGSHFGMAFVMTTTASWRFFGS